MFYVLLNIKETKALIFTEKYKEVSLIHHQYPPYQKYAVSLENLSLVFPTRSDTNQTVQPQQFARDLKFRIWQVDEFYYLCSEKKGGDRTAGLRLCFRIHKKLVFSCRGSNIGDHVNELHHEKSCFCIWENNNADQLCSNATADQCLCLP